MKRRKPAGRTSPTAAATKKPAARKPKRVEAVTRAELAALREEVRRKSGAATRWNANPEDVQKSVAQLVLALVEFLRKLLERQAVRRMEAGTLGDDQVENIGLALMKLEGAVHEMAAKFGLDPEDLNLDLGPLGRLH